MAIRTISATGGNWNSTATWVEGVVPTTADDVIGNATSGNLVVNVASLALTLNLSAYTATLEMRAELRVGQDTTAIGNVMVLGSGMTITAPLGIVGQLGVQPSRSVGRTIITNGCVIPFFFLGTNQNTIFITFGDNLTCNTFIQRLGNNNCQATGNQMNITNWVVSAVGGGAAGRLNGTTRVYLNGANCSWTIDAGALNTYQPCGLPIYIDTPGTLTISGYIYVNPFSTTSGIYYLQGTIAGNKVLRIGVPSLISGVNTIYNIDLNGSGTWDTIGIANNSINYQSTLNLQSNLNFNNLYILPDTTYFGASATRFPVRFTGTGALRGGGLYTNTTGYFNNPMSANTSNSGGIQLNTGVSHTIGYLSSIGGDDTSFNRVLIRSISGGTQANLSLTGNSQSVLFTNFTDINASGGNTIYAYKGTISNSQNILPITTYVPTSSNTFLNG
jgi:hypothetical protein